ncbi:TPA: DUF554 family protein, partial [Yersinia enterocolitica]
MVGPFIKSAGIILGGIIGVLLARHVPKRLQEGLPATFALASISIGIVMVVKVHFMPAVILALIIGTAVGELLSLEQGVKWGANKTRTLLERIIPSRSTLPPQEFAQSFSAMIVLFCASGLGVVGSLTEGITGDFQLLFVKALMDFFTALIFSISLGIALVAIA